MADENQKPAFSNNQHERLRRCSDAKNPGEWNDWVRDKPPGWQALLEGADFRNATLSGVDFQNAILKGAKFDHATINEAIFRSAQLNGASFVGATLKGVTLNYADLSYSQLQGANLSVQNHLKVRRISNLEKTNMCRANLSNTNLSGAKLLGARLNGAELIKTDISGANLQFAVVDAGTVIDRCIFDENTDFTAAGLDAAGIEPELKTAFKNNIRRIQWRNWFAKGNCAARVLKNCFVRPFWVMTGYGSSTANIIYYFIIFSYLFGSLYFLLEQTGRGIIDGLSVVGMPWYHTWLRGVYFSVVTMTTLGFGDLYAKAASYWGHVLLMAQVILGYVLLGALITRLGILFTGEAPAASPTSRKRKRRSR